MSTDEVCCTCASVLNAKPPRYSHERGVAASYSEKTTAAEKTASSANQYPILSNIPKPSRQLPCCNRLICTSCIAKNPRFESYCPFCQISSTPSSLPQGLRDPPAYNSRPPSPKLPVQDFPEHVQPGNGEQPPAYSTVQSSSSNANPQQQDTTHHLRPTDTLQSLSLAYNVPARILRTHNSLYSDHLLSARHTLAIPASHYSGPSLSPDPVDSEEETERKASIRRFMVAAKCSDYDVAELYLGQANGNVERALEVWREDERWERENPFRKGKMGVRRPRQQSNGTAKRSGTGGGLTGQLG